MTRSTTAEITLVTDAGYRIEHIGRPGDQAYGWTLADPDGSSLLIGDHGGIAPTQRAAVLEGLRRIELDQRPAPCACGDARRAGYRVEVTTHSAIDIGDRVIYQCAAHAPRDECVEAWWAALPGSGYPEITVLEGSVTRIR